MRLVATSVAAVLALGTIPAAAWAQNGAPITFETPGERTTSNIVTAAGVAGAGVVVGAIGLYFHLDSRSASDDVAADGPTGTPWTTERADLVDQADRSRTRAIIGYSIGGALLVGAIAYWIATDPPSETVVIRPRPAVQPVIAPTPGGATLGGVWSF